jgi:oligopeptide transport system permease protein
MIAAPPARDHGRAWQRFRRNRSGLAGGVVLLLFVAVALLGPVIATHDPTEQFLAPATGAVLDPMEPRDTGKFEAPSGTHLFGTDQLARDIFSRTLEGLRVSMAAALFTVLIAGGIGIAVGLAAASGPGWLDSLLMRGTDLAYAFPDLLLIILLRAALGDTFFGAHQVLGVDAGVFLLFLAIGLTAWPTMARLVRGQVLSVRETEFSMAAVAIGASPSRIAVRHWLPHAAGPVIVEATFLAPRAIFAEAALSFIGLGVSPPSASLGVLINDHFQFVMVQWTALAIPTAILALLFLGTQYLGDGLRDALDPRAGR